MASQPDKNQPSKDIFWVGFPDRSANLKRIVIPGNRRGLLLRTAANEAGKTCREQALTLGFKDLKTEGLMRLILPAGKANFSTRLLADTLGGELIKMLRTEFESDRWTVTLADRPKEIGSPQSAPRPDTKTISTIGLNIRGEEVVRDESGRYFRKVNLEDGKSDFIHEAGEAQHTLFLRALRRGDLDTIAASLVGMASRSTLQMEDFNRVLDAALEEGPGGRLEMPREDAAEYLRYNMLRYISGVAIEGDASRDRFQAALKLSSATGYVLSRPSSDGYSPSPAMCAFLRRITKGEQAVDLFGGQDLEVGVPRIRKPDAALQVHDLFGVPEEGVEGFVMNALSRRPEKGRSILFAPGRYSADKIERLRHDIGRNYGLETVTTISASVADGIQDSDPVIAFFIGDRRPEPLEALPQAALRSFNVVTADDLINLEREIIRARGRIRDFHEGVVTDIEERTDTREENQRQRPYQPLSKAREPFTMIPVALEGATAKALERVRRQMEGRGGVDAVVSSSLGMGIDDIGEVFNAEQVDAVAMCMTAHENGHGFLEADKMGLGKGQVGAAIAYAHHRKNPETNRIFYLTESASINVPDVCRDLKAVGGWGNIKVAMLTTGSRFTEVDIDAETGNELRREHKSLTPNERREIFESGTWPDRFDMIITTYSQFNKGEEHTNSLWIEGALNGNTKLILDEAHNALSKNSNMGRNIRNALRLVGPENVLYMTATQMRGRTEDLSLYWPLLPQIDSVNQEQLFASVASGGEVAQEAFATMLAEHGGIIRRDHDLSAIKYQVDLPDDGRMLQYQERMNRISPIVEMMIGATEALNAHLGNRHAADLQAALNRGLEPEAARAAANTMNQFSMSLGGPLATLNRLAMNAMKIEQTAERVMKEIAENRKPVITFHSTNEALIKDIVRETGGIPEDEADAFAALSFRDQISRLHETIYKVKIEGERQDAREVYPDVMEVSRQINQMIEALPDDMSAFPVDDLIERLEAHDLKIGEISGRTYCYRDGQIRKREGRDRRAVIDQFNEGDIDIIIYNQAGATGGSFHSSFTFKDQRQRVLVEMEAPLQIDKYVQSHGRIDRLNQRHKPMVVSIMTGLIPEMRIIQQRNAKLRKLGATVDGNRSHPMLLDDVPDLLNAVGDEATAMVLVSMPALARRLGFPEFAKENALVQYTRNDGAEDTGSGTAKSGLDSLASKVLARSMSLTASGQEDLSSRIQIEYEALIEELNSRNANPLEPRRLDGQVEIRGTSLFSGQERDDADLDTSVFLSPLYMSTGVHHFTEEAWDADKLVAAVEKARRLYGTDGFDPYAQQIHQNLPVVLRSYLPENQTMEDALANPIAAGSRFLYNHSTLTDLAWILENLKPGVMMRVPLSDDPDAALKHTVIGLVPPKHPDMFDIPSAYKVHTISPGMSKPRIISLSRMMHAKMEKIRFGVGISEEFNQSYLEEFARDAMITRRLPAQILHGNTLQAITEARRHDLGTISLYRDNEGVMHRGVVVTSRKIDMTRLPVKLNNTVIAAEFARQAIEGRIGQDQKVVSIWGFMEPGRDIGKREDSTLFIRVLENRMTVDIDPLRKTNHALYRSRPGLYEALHDEPLPRKADAPDAAYRRGRAHKYIVTIPLDTPENMARAANVVACLTSTSLGVDGNFRPVVLDITALHDRMAMARDGAAVTPDDMRPVENLVLDIDINDEHDDEIDDEAEHDQDAAPEIA